jgi:hypothetical protein
VRPGESAAVAAAASAAACAATTRRQRPTGGWATVDAGRHRIRPAAVGELAADVLTSASVVPVQERATLHVAAADAVAGAVVDAAKVAAAVGSRPVPGADAVPWGEDAVAVVVAAVVAVTAVGTDGSFSDQGADLRQPRRLLRLQQLLQQQLAAGCAGVQRRAAVQGNSRARAFAGSRRARSPWASLGRRGCTAPARAWGGHSARGRPAGSRVLELVRRRLPAGRRRGPGRGPQLAAAAADAFAVDVVVVVAAAAVDAA